MSGAQLEAYRHSGKFTVPGLILPVAGSALAAVPLGLAYSYVIRWIPFVYINLIVTLGYGMGFGWLVTRLLKAGKVRNTTLAVLTGLACGLCALYGEWSGHLHVVFEDSPWFFRPDQILTGMHYLYGRGTWSFHGNTVSGLPLGLVWLIEGGLIVGFTLIPPALFVRDTPFCEKTLSWLDEERKVDTLEAFTDAAQIGALESGDLQPIIDAKPKAADANSFARLLLKRSPRSQQFCTLRVQNVVADIDSKGNVTHKALDLTPDFIIPPSMFELVTQLEEQKPAGT